MTRKQRIIILGIIVLLVAYGLQVNKGEQLEFYILRNVGGDNFVKDSEPVFTEADIESYDSVTKTFYLSKTFMDKMNSGEFVTHDYTDSKGNLIQKDNYWFEGISLLDATYPDEFVIEIGDEEVFKGRFQRAAYSSYLPPGHYIVDESDGVRIVVGYDFESELSSFQPLDDYFKNK